MPPKKIMYLVRGGGGHMATIMAPTEAAAVKTFLENFPASPGDEISVKVRGKGGWSEFEVAEPVDPRLRGHRGTRH
jgi:hypothetical protein